MIELINKLFELTEQYGININISTHKKNELFNTMYLIVRLSANGNTITKIFQYKEWENLSNAYKEEEISNLIRSLRRRCALDTDNVVYKDFNKKQEI